MNESTALHDAAANNRYRCVEILLRSRRIAIDQVDSRFKTALHRASENGHWRIVRLLLDFHGDVSLVDVDGFNSLEMAILNDHSLTVDEFLRDSTWNKSMRNAQRSTTNEFHFSTPLRKLIRSMPNKAEEVFNRSISEFYSFDKNREKSNFYNYEFLDDQISVWKWKHGEFSRSTLTRLTKKILLFRSIRFSIKKWRR